MLSDSSIKKKEGKKRLEILFQYIDYLRSLHTWPHLSPWSDDSWVLEVILKEDCICSGSLALACR